MVQISNREMMSSKVGKIRYFTKFNPHFEDPCQHNLNMVPIYCNFRLKFKQFPTKHSMNLGVTVQWVTVLRAIGLPS